MAVINNKDILNRMLGEIERFEKDERTFYGYVENLWALYERLSEEKRTDEFVIQFHKYWDYLEEIRAIGESVEYSKVIRLEINIGLRIFLEDELTET